MTRSELTQQWRYHSTDWVTAVSAVHHDLLAVGSRNGRLSLLNELGVEVWTQPGESWLGSIESIDLLDDGWTQSSLAGSFLVCGYKSGAIRILRVREDAGHRQRLDQVYSYAANNTVRGIRSYVDRDRRTVTLVVASEDRHLYVFDLATLLSELNGYEPGTIETNGWIRAIDILTPYGEPPAIVSGCGDKNLYIHSLDRRELGKVFVDAKIHAIYAPPGSNTIYCTSDARFLYAIRRTGDITRMQWTLPLPHRAIHLIPLEGRRFLLAICDDARMYVIDPANRDIVGYFDTEDRVATAAEVTHAGSRMMLLGFTNGDLLAATYEVQVGPTLPDQGEGLIQPDHGPLSDSDYASVVLTGLRGSRQSVGIARFLQIVPGRATGSLEQVVLAATDQGYVFALGIGDRHLSLIAKSERLGQARVWAVDGKWIADDCLEVFAATSDRNITVLTWTVGGDRIVTDSARHATPLSDWPREIRRVPTSSSDSTLFAFCESGEVVAVDHPEWGFRTDQVLRSGFARVRNGDAMVVLTGSDDQLVTFFEDGVEKWRYPTSDRVREVLMTDDTCIAVSEDRYLYVLSLGGELLWRYRFPHRALSVTLSLDPTGEAAAYFVGCGDGFVYVLSASGFLSGALSYPDRIRDLVLVNDEQIVVACEDGFTYLSPVPSQLDKWLQAQWGQVDLAEIVDTMASELRREQNLTGNPFDRMTFAKQLLLLDHIEQWNLTQEERLVFALFDRVIVQAMQCPQVRPLYLVARAIFWASTHVNLGAGLSRLDSFLEAGKGRPHASHAALAAMIDVGLAGVDDLSEKTALVDAVVCEVEIADSWVLEEAVRLLGDLGYFDCTLTGFTAYGTSHPAPYDRLTALVNAAAASSTADDPEIVAFLEMLASIGSMDETRYAQEISRWEAKVPSQLRSLMVEARTLAFGVDNLDERLRTFRQSVVNPMSYHLRELVSRDWNSFVSADNVGNFYKLLSELIDQRFLVIRPSMTNEDFLRVRCLLSGLSALSVANTQGAPS